MEIYLHGGPFALTHSSGVLYCIHDVREALDFVLRRVDMRLL